MPGYKIDMHVHTAESSWCARIPGGEIPRLYRAAGYDGIVITDHYLAGFFDQQGERPWPEKLGIFLRGYQQARDAGLNCGLQVFLGLEIRLANGNDYLIYGADQEFLLAFPELYRLALPDLKTLANQHGVLVLQAHPYRYGEHIALPQHLDGVEVCNGNITDPGLNQRAYAFACQHHLAMVSGSDFHDLANLAKGGVVFRHPISGERELAEAIRSQAGMPVIFDQPDQA